MNGATKQRADLAVWPTVGAFFGLRDELDRLFHSSLESVAQWRTWNPAVDVYEDKDNVFVQAELAGLKKEEIEVSLEDNELTISGERKGEQKTEGNNTHRSERFAGKFERSIVLASDVKGGEVTANYKDGILTITLPKAEAAKRKQIDVKIN